MVKSTVESTVKSTVQRFCRQNTVKSTVKSTVQRFCRKYCNVLIHCQYLVDGMYSQEYGQEYSRTF